MYVFFQFVDGAFCRSDHWDGDAVALFGRGVELAVVEVRYCD